MFFFFFTLIVVDKGIFGSGSVQFCSAMSHALFKHTFWRENRNVSYIDSGYLNVYAVILLIIASGTKGKPRLLQ